MDRQGGVGWGGGGGCPEMEPEGREDSAAGRGGGAGGEYQSHPTPPRPLRANPRSTPSGGTLGSPVSQDSQNICTTNSLSPEKLGKNCYVLCLLHGYEGPSERASGGSILVLPNGFCGF